MNVIKLVLLAGTAASCPLGSAGNRDIMEPDMAQCGWGDGGVPEIAHGHREVSCAA